MEVLYDNTQDNRGEDMIAYLILIYYIATKQLQLELTSGESITALIVITILFAMSWLNGIRKELIKLNKEVKK